MQERFNYHQGQTISIAAVNAFMRGVYRWMGAGLAVTAVVAGLMTSYLKGLNVYELQQFMSSYGFMFIGLLIAEIALVFVLSAAIHKMSAPVATGVFLAYCGLSGLTLAAVLFGYTYGSIVSAFVATTAMFAGLSIYGMFTSRDLTGLGPILTMALIGMLIGFIINMFLGSPAFDYLLCAIGVVIFAGLTAYDSQKLRQMGEMMPQDDAVAVRRGTILGALTLYLDFINLFIMLLHLFGNRE
ncbi:MAG: Bax inhibitor-1/YccA family protein [Desulfovibrionaceae bacterium]|nr:Bax inhibitor-1/YccA family protein [Desulfovibrionaceae bacterium]